MNVLIPVNSWYTTNTGSGYTSALTARESTYQQMTFDESVNRQTVDQQADEMALITLYEQFRRPIHSYSYRLLGSQEDADDVTQEVFMRAFTSWEGLYERGHLSSWLYRIATNLCVDMLRRRKRFAGRFLSLRSRFDTSSSDEMMQDDLTAFLTDSGGIPEIAEREMIRTAMDSIPPEYSVALVLNAAQGISYQEIAQILHISPNAAATRISRAKRMFAKEYQRVSKDGVGKREH